MQVSQKLKKYSLTAGIPFNKICDIFALERLVARLDTDAVLSEGLTYKGGFVLFKITATERFTRDVDATIKSVAKNVLTDKLLALWQLDLSDGIAFGDPELTELQISDGDYGGVRLALRYQLDVPVIEKLKMRKLPRINIDISLGDTGYEVAHKTTFAPIYSDGPHISWKTLSVHYIFAEKLQTMIARGDSNSRAKDIYDMWHLSKSLPNLDELSQAIRQVFENRKTALPLDLAAAAHKIKLDSLRQSWNSVQLKSWVISFDQIFAELMIFLKKIK